jgi:hypothetical protein
MLNRFLESAMVTECGALFTTAIVKQIVDFLFAREALSVRRDG